MADVNVTFSAVDEGFSAGIDKMRQQERTLTPGGPGAGILTPLPAGLGGAPADTLLARATTAAKENATAKGQMVQADREAAQAEDEVGQASERAGINIGRMMERMATRMVIFGVIFEGLRLLKEAFAQAAEVQTAEVRFESLSQSIDKASGSLDQLQGAARESFTNITELTPVMLDLEKAGIAGQPAVDLVRNIAEYAHVAGVPVKELGDTMAHLATHQASITEMLNTAQLLGESTQKAVQAYHQRVIDTPIIAAEEARASQLQQRGFQDAERSLDVQTKFVDKIGLGARLFKDYMAPRGLGETPVAPRILGDAEDTLAQKFWDRMGKGMEQLKKDTGESEERLKHFFQTGQLGESDLLAAAKTYDEQEQLAITRREQDKTRDREETQRTDLLKLQRQELTEIERGVGLQQKSAAYSQTVAGATAKAAEDIKEFTEHSKDLLAIMTGWAKAIDSMVHGVQQIPNVIDAMSKFFGSWVQRDTGAPVTRAPGPRSWEVRSPEELKEIAEHTRATRKSMEDFVSAMNMALKD